MSGHTERFFASSTGRGISVAIVDSGIHAAHPHVAGIAGGIALAGTEGDTSDTIGHGTAVAAAVREKAPAAELFAVKVFDRALTAGVGLLVAAIGWAVERRLRVVNLSLGTANQEHEAILREAVERAREVGTIVVAAGSDASVRWLPGSLPGVVSVLVDWDCPREEYRIVADRGGAPLFRASGYPRPIPGRPPERNLRGGSFAVANMTGFVARSLEAYPNVDFEALVAVLHEEVTLCGRSER
jgi:subtilisin family serine protease